ncbi:MAG: LuxR C-terminal-related transcriptional regulator [Ktedonobacterales bacterium]
MGELPKARLSGRRPRRRASVIPPHELKVMRLYADGLRPDAIAQQLALKLSTVRSYIRDVCAALEVSGAHEAAANLRKLGML